MKNSIVQFVKRVRMNQFNKPQLQIDGKPVLRKVGVFFAFKDSGTGKIAIGISKTHRKDKFDPNMGLLIAKGHALDSLYEGVDVPYSFGEDFVEFKERCKRYFKYEMNGDVRNAVDSDFVEIRIESSPAERRSMVMKARIKAYESYL